MQGQGNINVRLKQSNYNHNDNYNCMGFDTIEINLVDCLRILSNFWIILKPKISIYFALDSSIHHFLEQCHLLPLALLNQTCFCDVDLTMPSSSIVPAVKFQC